MSTSTAGALFRQGDLDGAIDAAGDAVRQAPTDFNARLLLAELLLFAGDFERSDALLDAASAIDPDASLVVVEFRQLPHAASSRPMAACRSPSARSRRRRRWFSRRSSACAPVTALPRPPPRRRPWPRSPRRRTGNGAQFDDFRDADDLCAVNFEVLTTTGKYYWIPTERVASAEFHPPRRPRDLFWRRSAMSVHECPDLEVYLPALYDDTLLEGNRPLAAHVRLCRGTEWSEAAPVLGLGQRVHLAGEDGVPLTALERLAFA